jgi:hypothetical protein
LHNRKIAKLAGLGLPPDLYTPDAEPSFERGNGSDSGAGIFNCRTTCFIDGAAAILECKKGEMLKRAINISKIMPLT